MPWVQLQKEKKKKKKRKKEKEKRRDCSRGRAEGGWGREKGGLEEKKAGWRFQKDRKDKRRVRTKWKNHDNGPRRRGPPPSPAPAYLHHSAIERPLRVGRRVLQVGLGRDRVHCHRGPPIPSGADNPQGPPEAPLKRELIPAHQQPGWGSTMQNPPLQRQKPRLREAKVRARGSHS